MVQFTGEAYSEGVEIVERDQVQLRVYSVAKTVADCFKHRNKIGFDVAQEALKDARAKKKASADDILLPPFLMLAVIADRNAASARRLRGLSQAA
jgi:predicted transcriptional regulator of viral defense system